MAEGLDEPNAFHLLSGKGTIVPDRVTAFCLGRG